MTRQLLSSTIHHSLQISALALISTAFAQISPARSRLQKQGSTAQVIVDEKPFLILFGELGNSSSPNMEYMKPV